MLAVAYERLAELTEAGRWDEIEALAEEIGMLCDLARKLTPADLSDPKVLAASQHVLKLQPILAGRLEAQLEELQSLMAAARNNSRIQKNYGYSP